MGSADGHNRPVSGTEPISEKPGDRIGRYRLIECIGSGGSGVVYLAEQEEPVRRRVALKILKLGMDTQSVVARFEAERQALALMDHPNIARVLDAGATETGRPFFVMELVSGQRLSDYCSRHALALPRRLELFVTVCQAVQHAHQKGIIHRDLKPSNILVVDQEGVPVPKVIDFGIAKATEQGLDEQGGLTSVNLFLGTPAYMSPEQVEYGGRDIDTRSDIYSLGVILYELLAGHPPFDPKELAGAGIEEMRRMIREVDPPRPSTAITRNLNPARLPSRRQPEREQLAAVRGDLDWIAMKCLEKNRARRYETANGLAADIRRHLDNEPVLARPPSQLYRLQKTMRRHRIGFGAAAVVALVLVGAVIVSSRLAWRAQRAEQEQSRLRDLAEAKAAESRLRLIRRYVAEGNRLTEQGLPLAALPWLVQALELETGDPQRESDERLRIAQALVGAPQLRLHLSQGKSVNCLALSPDGSLLATGSDDGTVRISTVADGGQVSTNLLMPGTVRRVRFSADGALVVAVDKSGRARVWNAASGEALTPIFQADDFNENSLGNLADQLKPEANFSPNGKFLLLAWGSKSAQLREARSGHLIRQFTHAEVVYQAVFSPDGRLVLTSSKDGTAQVWDTATGKPAGPALKHGGFVAWAQFSSDGNTVMTVRDRHDVQLWDWRDGRRLAPEIPRRSVLSHASLSPDGRRVLTTARSGYALLFEAASSRRVYQFEHPGGLVDAAFSPDGQYVTTACHDGNAWLWDLNDESRRPMKLAEGNQIEEICFSSDGGLLAVASRGGHARVWELFPPPRGVRRLPGSDVQCVEFDRSGRRALVANTGRQNSVAVYDVDTAKLLMTAMLDPGEAGHARFSPDGRSILAFGNGPTAVVLDSASGRQLIPPLTHEDRVEDALWSPDGKCVLTAAGAAGARLWDTATGKLVVAFPHSNPVRAVGVSSDGARVASSDKDNTVQIWKMPAGWPLGAPLVTREKIRQIEFSPDGKRLAISTDAPGAEGVVEVRDVDSGQVLGQLLVHRDAVESFEFSQNGAWLATACNDHTVRVWDAATGAPVSAWLPHDYEARLAIFSPDGARLITLARRGAVRLWSLPSGEPLTAPIVYPRNSGDGWVSLSPDGYRLLLARGGNEAWLRELQPETGTLEELKLRAQVLSCTQFDPAAGMVPIDEAALDRAWKLLRALRHKN